MSATATCLPAVCPVCPVSSRLASLASSSISGVAWSFSGPGRVARCAAARSALANTPFQYLFNLRYANGVFVIYLVGGWEGFLTPSWLGSSSACGSRLSQTRVSFVPVAGLFGV